MTLGEKLLQLNVEYQNVLATADAIEEYGPEGASPGRDLAAIGADYEETLRELLR